MTDQLSTTDLPCNTNESPTRGVGRRDYAERKAARIERLTRRAEQLAGVAERRFGAANRIASIIPMGQPILVGHHSEKRHRRDISRIDDNMRAGVAAQKASADAARRAAAAEDNRSISSDDPEAVVKLKEKLAKLTSDQEKMKAMNACIRKHAKGGSLAQQAALLKEFDIGQIAAERLCTPDFCGRIGFPDYAIKNNGAEIRRTEKRIAELVRAAELPEIRETHGAIGLVVADNRVQLHFPGKPSEEVRTELKQNGFRWAPSEGAWQRKANNSAIYAARQLAKKHGSTT